MCYGLIQLPLEELQLAPVVTSVLRVQSHGLWGRYGDSVGQVRPWEALPRSLAGEGAAFGRRLWQAGGCESSSHEVFPWEQSEYKHGSSLRHECGLVCEGGSGGRVRWRREAGEGLVGWLVEVDCAGSGPGRVWVAPGTAHGSRGGSFLWRGGSWVTLALF